MPNFFTDNADIRFHFDTMDLREIVALKEGDFSERQKFPYAPASYEDAVDGYRRILELVGQIAGDVVAPRAPEVDAEGAQLHDGVVTYAHGTREALQALSGADLMGFTLPRRYGGLNLPTILYTSAIEMVSRADAALMTIFGLQDIAETINSFASEDQKQRYLPKFCSGEVTGAMVLTEPDAGSDLQAVRLRAYQEPDGQWRLNGVKRFITNGCGDVLLVLARTEEGTRDGRGLSMLLCEKGPKVVVRRIEDKLGIHGSPTCELHFKDAPAELVGQRRRGLTKYVMALMNGARIGIAAQGPRHRRGGLPRRARLRRRARAVRQAHRGHGAGRRPARLDESRHRERAVAALRDLARGGPGAGLRAPRRDGGPQRSEDEGDQGEERPL